MDRLFPMIQEFLPESTIYVTGSCKDRTSRACSDTKSFLASTFTMMLGAVGFNYEDCSLPGRNVEAYRKEYLYLIAHPITVTSELNCEIFQKMWNVKTFEDYSLYGYLDPYKTIARSCSNIHLLQAPKDGNIPLSEFNILPHKFIINGAFDYSLYDSLETCDELYDALVKILPKCALKHSFKVEFRPKDKQWSNFECDHDHDNVEKLLTCSFLWGATRQEIKEYETYNDEAQCIPESLKDKLKNIQIIFNLKIN